MTKRKPPERGVLPEILNVKWKGGSKTSGDLVIGSPHFTVNLWGIFSCVEVNPPGFCLTGFSSFFTEEFLIQDGEILL